MRRIAAVAWVLAVSLVGAPAAGSGEPVYHQDVLFTWNQLVFDIVVVPPNHGQLYNGNGPLGGGDPGELTPENSYLRAIEDSIQAWDDAIERFAHPFIRRHFESRVYVAGRDPLPEDDEEIEILIVTDESKAVVLGVAVYGDPPCIVDNSKLFVESFTYEDMFNVNGQEYGHCLGLAHVRDNEPEHDVMDGSYDDTPGATGVHLHCPSNLNVYGLGGSLGVVAPKFPPVLPASRYRQTRCDEKFPSE
jgi:hypothetical protein